MEKRKNVGNVKIKLAFEAGLKPKICTITDAESGVVLWIGSAVSLAFLDVDKQTRIRVHYEDDEEESDTEMIIETDGIYDLRRHTQI